MFGVQAVDLRTYKRTGHYDARTQISTSSAKLYTALRTVIGKPVSREKPYFGTIMNNR